jgi:hypothetical protein
MASEINRLRVPPSVTRSPSASTAETSSQAKPAVTPQSPRSADAFVADAASRTPSRSSSINNNFRRVISGTHPAPVASGFFEGLKQANETRKLASYASLSVLSGGRTPPDTAVEAKLRSMQLTPVLPGPTSIVDYTSTVPGASAQSLYEKFVSNPGAVFNASGDLSFRPPTAKLTQGARIMIEDKGPPPLWMPVQVRLDPARREIQFQTLDGHALRGTNTFRFSDDGKGNARIEQHSVFQFSSLPASIGNGVFGGSDRQHKTWEGAHAYLFRALAVQGTGK